MTFCGSLRIGRFRGRAMSWMHRRRALAWVLVVNGAWTRKRLYGGMVGRKMHDVNYVANMVRSGRGCATAKNGRTFAVPFRGAKSSQAKQKMQQVVVRVLRDGLYAQRGIV